MDAWRQCRQWLAVARQVLGSNMTEDWTWFWVIMLLLTPVWEIVFYVCVIDTIINICHRDETPELSGDLTVSNPKRKE